MRSFLLRRLLTPAECLGGYPTPRNADGLGCGVGCRVGLSRARWSIPRNLPDAYWLDPIGAPLSKTYVVQPTGPVDADNEAADTSAYTDLYNAPDLLSKEAGAPSGSGSQVLQLQVSGGGSYVDAAQSSAIGAPAGNREQHTLWIRASAACEALIQDQASNILALSVTTDWARVTGDITMTGAWRDVTKKNVDAAKWVEIDEWAIENISLASVAPRQGTGDLVQATATAQMWSDAATGGIRFDGTADFAPLDTVVGAWPLHKAQGFGWSARLVMGTGSATIGVIYSTAADAAGVGIRIAYDEANQKIIAQVANGTGTFECEGATANGSVTRNAAHDVTINWSEADGLTILVNAAAAVTQASGGAASVADATYVPTFGKDSAGNFFDGIILEMVVSKVALGASDLAHLHAHMVDA